MFSPSLHVTVIYEEYDETIVPVRASTKGSGVVFGENTFHMVDSRPKTTPDPLRLRARAPKKLVAGCLHPKYDAAPRPSPPGIPSQIRQAREAQGLTWYALARLAGTPNQATIRDIEQGKDVHLSNLQAVAAALGLKLELVDQVA